MIVGTGSHRYEVTHGWGELPDRVRYGYTHGVVCDAAHRIFVHNQSPDAVVIFDENGKFIKSWGAEFAAGAHGMWLHREGGQEFLYLSDYVRHIVVKTTLDGEIVYTLGWPAESGVYQSAEQYKPTNAAVAPNGDVYVADGYGLSWIHHYNGAGQYLRSFGGKGSGPGQLDCPHGLWVDTRQNEPNLLVADRANQRLQSFTLDGRHIGFVTSELRRPCHFDALGEELVIPDLWGRVTIFDRDNRLIAHLGDSPGVWNEPAYPNLPGAQRTPGRFISPHAACFDPEGDIYVVEWISDGRVTRLHRL